MAFKACLGERSLQQQEMCPLRLGNSQGTSLGRDSGVSTFRKLMTSGKQVSLGALSVVELRALSAGLCATHKT